MDVKANSDFHTLTTQTVFGSRQDKPFLEYRRRWHEYPQRLFVGDFPLHLDIESTSRCNLRCPFCYTQFSKIKFRHGDIKFSLVKKILDEGSAYGLYAVKFNFRGEPLLHQGIDRMVRYAKKKGILDVFFNTNAVLLNDNMINKLIDAGLDRITISIEGYNKKTYEKYRVGAKFDAILKNLKNLADIRKKRNVFHPKVRIQCLLFSEVKDSLKAYAQFWSSYSDEVSYLEYRDDNVDYGGIVYPWVCPQLWQRLIILYDGTIVPCCCKVDVRMSLGNADDISIKEAWKSKTLDTYRRLHKEGNAHKIPFCNNCSFRAMQIKKIKSEAKCK